MHLRVALGQIVQGSVLLPELKDSVPLRILVGMGKTFKPEDIVDSKRRLRDALSDLSPGVREQVEEILETHSDVELRTRLSDVLGDKKAREILRVHP